MLRNPRDWSEAPLLTFAFESPSAGSWSSSSAEADEADKQAAQLLKELKEREDNVKKAYEQEQKPPQPENYADNISDETRPEILRRIAEQEQKPQ